MNKDLYGNRIELPEDVVGYLKQCYDAVPDANDKIEGYRRNQELRDSGFVTYQQLKRMKNFFDNHNSDNKDKPFILNGGHFVKNWVNQTLSSMRNNVSLSKDIKSTVLPNQYIQPHEKNDIKNMNRPSKDHNSVLGLYLPEVTEDVKRINNIMKKII